MPKVLNRHHFHGKPLPDGSVYIGRGTPYGNPFVVGVDGTREECVAKFTAEVLPTLDVSALRGHDLVCSCARPLGSPLPPLACHGDPILIKANQ
jgi:hypothetical protein